MATLDIPFALNTQLWWVGHGHTEEWITCPDCGGIGTLTVVLGTGEKHTLACEGCTRGCERALGQIKRTVYKFEPRPFIARRVNIYGDSIMYSRANPDAQAYGLVDSKDLFTSKEECGARCVELTDQRNREWEEGLVRNLLRGRKKMAWSVHYWRRRVRDLEADLGRAKDRLDECKRMVSK